MNTGRGGAAIEAVLCVEVEAEHSVSVQKGVCPEEVGMHLLPYQGEPGSGALGFAEAKGEGRRVDYLRVSAFV